MYKGPDIPIRTARLFRGTGDCLNIYDYQNHELQIGPFDYKAWPYAERYYLLPGNSCLFILFHELFRKDALIRQYLSTSPNVEKPDFAHCTKEAIKVIMQHPEPLETFFQNKVRKYKRKSDGFWELIDVSFISNVSKFPYRFFSELERFWNFFFLKNT